MTQPRGRATFFGFSLLVRAFESSFDGVEIDDIEGVVIYVNDAWCDMFQRERSSAIGAMGNTLQIEGADAQQLRRSWEGCIRDEHSVGLFSLRRPDGSIVAVTYTRTLYKNADGNPTAVITIFRTAP